MRRNRERGERGEMIKSEKARPRWAKVGGRAAEDKQEDWLTVEKK